MSIPGDTITPSPEERNWAVVAHLSALLGGLLTGYIFGLGCIVGPLIVWLVKKDSLPFVSDQGREALNFNLTVALTGLVLLLLTIVTFGVGAVIAFPVGLLVGVGWFVLTIIAAVKASGGVAYRYPFTIRLIS